MYLMAVYFTQLVHDNADKPTDMNRSGDPVIGFRQSEAALQHYFGSVGMSFLSLFQAITGGVDWDDLSFPLLGSVSPFACIAFACYIAFTLIAMMNVVTGVFVESAMKSAKEDNDFFMINNMREVFKEANGGITGVMTWKTFQSQLDQPNMKAYFRAIDVDVSEAKGLFRLLDLDGSGSIDAEEFLSGCLRLRGPAKALDLALLIHETKRLTKAFKDQKKAYQGRNPGTSKSVPPGRHKVITDVSEPSASQVEAFREPTAPSLLPHSLTQVTNLTAIVNDHSSSQTDVGGSVTQSMPTAPGMSVSVGLAYEPGRTMNAW